MPKQNSPIHRKFLSKESPVISSRGGGIKAVADFLSYGQRYLEGIGPQLGCLGTARVGTQGIKRTGVLWSGRERGK